jgi:hypothetical protein
LKQGARLPKLWGALAILAAVGIVVSTLPRLGEHPWLVTMAAVLFLAGVVIQRRVPVHEYWPIAAILTAMVVGGFTSLLHHTTFRGVLEHVHGMNVRTQTHRDIFGDLSAMMPSGNTQALFKFDPELEQDFLQGGNLLQSDRFSELHHQFDHWEKHEHDQLSETTRRLEVAIVGSLGFWITIGLLATWNLRERGFPADTSRLSAKQEIVAANQSVA